MTIRYHPSEETLTRYSAGTLEPGPRLVVSVHLTGCEACRTRVMEYEAVGGALLEELPVTPMAPEALARTLAMIDAPEPIRSTRRERLSALLPGGGALPEPLHACEIGRWRWLAPGIRWSRITLPQDASANVGLLRVGPGKELPEHGHTGTEFTQVLVGSFSEGSEHFLPGDLAEADADVEHQPVVDLDGECICLIAMEGRMRLRGLVGRMLQPFIGI
jgi:putative transcriptional regulator